MMIKKDEDALICDFAETYNIYDYKSLPLKMVGSLALGLRDNSRIKMAMTGSQASSEVMLMAAMVDRLSLLVWMKTKDAEKGKNKPKSILENLTKSENIENTNIAYTSGEDFIRAREELLNTSQEVN